jgi:hypothetical protein
MHIRKRADEIKLPTIVAPSGEFEGNDGKWSTFTINIGDHDGSGGGQNFDVLISTSSSLTMVPNQAEWCDAECAPKRGIEIFNAKQPRGFESSSSQSWKELGQYNLPLPNWWPGEKPNATWGSDNVGLGQSSKDSPILQEQWVVEYTVKELFMGSFGLAIEAVSAGTGSKSPFLYNFAGQNLIPSASYGYTAGAYYREYLRLSLQNCLCPNSVMQIDSISSRKTICCV